MAATKKISLYTASAIVIANMIGTGVFTSLGFQLADIQSVFPLIMLWVVGGITALCGALSYAELAAALPRSGGEYHFLREIYHPSLGFVSGWVSSTVGFAAPTALAAMALGQYATSVYPEIQPQWLAASVVLVLTAIHATSKEFGSKFQNIFTSVKVILIFLFIVAGFFVDAPQNASLLPKAGDWELMTSSAFAVSLIYVSYAYTGWNAAVYLAGEVEKPRVNVPIALFGGTALVMALYVLLNYIFLYTTPMQEMEGAVEVGYIAAISIFGQTIGKLTGMTISVLLISTVSAMVFAGPRVMQTMGEDIGLLRFLSKTRNDIPVNAVFFQCGLTLVFILTSSFDQVLTYAGFTLSLMTLLTVLGVFILRWKQPGLARPYKAWGYPVTPAIFVGLVLWTLIFLLQYKTFESLAGFATVGVGLAVYYLLEYPSKKKS